MLWSIYIMVDTRHYSAHTTLHKFEVWGIWKVPQMWHSPFKLNLYVDYGNMIHFAVSAWTLEMSLNTDSPFCPIWWWILPTFNQPSKVQAFSAKWIIFPYSTYKLGLNGLCHIHGTFYWPQTSNLWDVVAQMPDYYPMHRIDVFIPKIVFIKPIINNMIHFSKKKNTYHEVR